MRIVFGLATLAFAAALPLSASLAAGHPVAPGTPADNAVAFQINAAHTGDINMSMGFSTPLKLSWSHVFNTSFSGPNYPVIADGMVFISAVLSSTSTTTFAFDQTNGDVVWSKVFNTNLPSLVYDNGTVFVPGGGGLITALDSLTGTQKWAVQLPDDTGNTSYPIAVNGMFYTGGGHDDGNMYAVRESDGSLAWGMTGFPDDGGSPAYGNKALYVGYPCLYFKLNALKPKVEWFDDEACAGGGSVQPVSFGKRVYVSDAARSNVVLDSKNGHSVDTFPGDTMPTIFTDVRGRQYGVGLTHNTLICWKLSTGTTAWTFAGDSNLATQPIGVNGLVVVGSSRGMLYVLDGKSGKLKWSTNTKLVLETLAAGQGVLVAGGSNTVQVYVPQ